MGIRSDKNCDRHTKTPSKIYSCMRVLILYVPKFVTKSKFFETSTTMLLPRGCAIDWLTMEVASNSLVIVDW